MKVNPNKLLIILAVGLSFISCNKQRQYPSESVTGNNVFGCFINQKQFLPCASFLQWRLKSSGQNLSSPVVASFTVEARNLCDKHDTYGRYTTINFSNLPIEENRKYKFGGFYNYQVSCTYSEDGKYFYTDSTLSGSITIRKFDPVLRILSADFDAVLKQKDSTAIVTITHGTFDVTLL